MACGFPEHTEGGKFLMALLEVDGRMAADLTSRGADD